MIESFYKKKVKKHYFNRNKAICPYALICEGYVGGSWCTHQFKKCDSFKLKKLISINNENI